MKVKGTIEFAVMLIVILLLYFVFITNIDYITMSYHGKLEEYKNIYYKESQEPNILYELRETEEYSEAIPDEVIKTIKNNKMIRNILKEFKNLNEAGINKYVDYLRHDGNMYLVKDDIIYIIEDDYELAFTLNMNNVIYQKNMENMATMNRIDWSNREITIENKYDIYKEAEKQLIKLGIAEKFQFEPETIYFKYAIEGDIDSDGYTIEDNKNHIKLDVRRPNYDIERLQIGFTEPLE